MALKPKNTQRTTVVFKAINNHPELAPFHQVSQEIPGFQTSKIRFSDETTTRQTAVDLGSIDTLKTDIPRHPVELSDERSYFIPVLNFDGISIVKLEGTNQFGEIRTLTMA